MSGLKIIDNYLYNHFIIENNKVAQDDDYVSNRILVLKIAFWTGLMSSVFSIIYLFLYGFTFAFTFYYILFSFAFAFIFIYLFKQRQKVKHYSENDILSLEIFVSVLFGLLAFFSAISPPFIFCFYKFKFKEENSFTKERIEKAKYEREKNLIFILNNEDGCLQKLLNKKTLKKEEKELIDLIIHLKNKDKDNKEILSDMLLFQNQKEEEMEINNY